MAAIVYANCCKYADTWVVGTVLSCAESDGGWLRRYLCFGFCMGVAGVVIYAREAEYLQILQEQVMQVPELLCELLLGGVTVVS
ncbi:hypothetical protein U1Q18_001123 [Sarracenia purpurea var. burkii]